MENLIENKIEKWAKDWENSKEKIKIIKELKEFSKGCEFSTGELRDLIRTKILEDKTKEKQKVNDEKESSKKKALKEAEQKAEEIFNKKKQTKTFIKQKPFLYDKNKIWWLWDDKNFRWIKVDEIDVLNMINKSVGADIITPNERQIIINTLKQEGRKNTNSIKENKDTWVQFRNRIVDIETSEEFEATPEFFITNPIPWELGDSEETPTIDKLLREWAVYEGVQDESYIQTLYEILAYSILPSAPLQRIICLVGFGANGKSSYLQLIEKFVGSENTTSTEIELLKSRFESSRLFLKLVCFVGEIDKGIFQQTATLKRLSGEDTMRIEFKGKDGFDAHLYCKPMIACNILPETTDKSLGFYRRWLIIDFLNKFKKQTNILKTIPDWEFNNLARKSIRILQEVLSKGSFTNEGTFEERQKKYEEHANPLDNFIQDQCNYNPENKIHFDEFYSVFQDWLKSNGYRLQTKRELGVSIQNNNLIRKAKVKTKKTDGSETTAYFVRGVGWKEKEIEAVEEVENA